VSFNSTADKPMVIVIDAKARRIIAVADVDMPSTRHGITRSPDGKYIYIPSGPSATGGRGRTETRLSTPTLCSPAQDRGLAQGPRTESC
jgi:hypothetical protein